MLGTSAVGNESLVTNNFIDVTLDQITSALNSVDIEAKAVVTPEGFELTAALNTVNVWGLVGAGVSTTYTIVSTTQTPDWQQVA